MDALVPMSSVCESHSGVKCQKLWMRALFPAKVSDSFWALGRLASLAPILSLVFLKFLLVHQTYDLLGYTVASSDHNQASTGYLGNV